MKDFDIGNRQLIFLTGKGGIGKSLLTSALALRASKQGLKVQVVQKAAKDHLGALFGVQNVNHEFVDVNKSLSVANFTTGGNFRDFVVKHLKRGSLFETLASNKVVHSFFGAIPGFGELMMLGRLYYMLNLAPEKPDLVIVDSFASGHFLSLMTTPTAVLESGLSGPISKETESVRNFLADQARVGVVLVGVPEDLVVSEMIDFIPQIDKRSPAKLISVVFNRVLHDSGKAFDSDFLARRLAMQKSAMQKWRMFSESDGCKQINHFEVPDVGFIEEPVSEELVETLLKFSGRPLK
ncbi:MAG: hypothetical protein NT027_03710 [Proteobacteria bacterium]|nr:hypothetical protein [Pseudomonadota bacterium]